MEESKQLILFDNKTKNAQSIRIERFVCGDLGRVIVKNATTPLKQSASRTKKYKRDTERASFYPYPYLTKLFIIRF